MSATATAARIDGVIDQHVDAITNLTARVLDPQLDPLQRCRHADMLCRILSSSTEMLEQLYRELGGDTRQAGTH